MAAAAILAATYGPLLTKEALDSKMRYLSPSCLIEKVDHLLASLNISMYQHFDHMNVLFG